MRSMPPIVRSSLSVAGVYSEAGPTPMRLEWMSLVCRMVNVLIMSGRIAPSTGYKHRVAPVTVKIHSRAENPVG